MKNSKGIYSVALDIGASKVSILIGEKEIGGRVRIISGTSVPLKDSAIKRGEIENSLDVTKAINTLLETIKREDNIEIQSAVVAISGLTTTIDSVHESVEVEYPDEISYDDVDALYDKLGYIDPKPGHSIVDTLTHSYRIDEKSDILDPVGTAGNVLHGEFSVIFGNEGRLAALRRAITRSNIEIEAMVPIAIASAEAVLTEDDKELGVCVVDLGATTIEIAIYHNNKLRHIYSLPFGMSLLNNDINSWGVFSRVVENLKVQHGEAISNYASDCVMIEIPGVGGRNREIPLRTLAKIIESRMSEIIRLVKDVIDDAGYLGRISEGIVLTGGGAKLKNVDRLFKQMTAIETRIGTPSIYVNGIDNEIMHDPRYATLIGVLLKSFAIERYGVHYIGSHRAGQTYPFNDYDDHDGNDNSHDSNRGGWVSNIFRGKGDSARARQEELPFDDYTREAEEQMRKDKSNKKGIFIKVMDTIIQEED